MMGCICSSIVLAKSSSVRKVIPNGKKKRRDMASPAANPPNSSGAPTTCASQGNNGGWNKTGYFGGYMDTFDNNRHKFCQHRSQYKKCADK